MKRFRALFAAAILCLSWLLPCMAENGTGADEPRALTLMVYLCGSNLESAYGSASLDLAEMKEAEFDPGRTSLLVMAGGTSAWMNGTDAAETTIREIRPGKERIVWRSSALNMGAPDTLTHLLRFGMERYPAERYALIFWDHGGGPLEGVCWDELFSMDSLTLSELTAGLTRAELPEKLAWIGFDACLMSSAEVASALSPYADYMIASQETEPASGWDYRFLSRLDPDASGAEAGKQIIDSYFDSLAGSGDLLTMACVDLSRMDHLKQEMNRYFSAAGDQISQSSFETVSKARMSSSGFGEAVRAVGSGGFDMVDLADLISHSGGETDSLQSALADAVVCSRSTEPGAGGLSVYHPWQNKQKYLERWRQDYQRLDFSQGYLRYLLRFGELLTGKALTDWSGLTMDEETFSASGSHLLSMPLTAEQRANAASAQLIVMESVDEAWGQNKGSYSPVAVEAASLEDSSVTASYAGRALYVLDEEDRVLTGPISYLLSDDGQYISVLAYYNDYSSRASRRNDTAVLYRCVLDEETQDLEIIHTYVYDWVSETYTNRIPFSPEGFTDLSFQLFIRNMPETAGAIPGFDSWDSYGGYLQRGQISLPVNWHLRFLDEWEARNLYAMFQITDIQQNTWVSRPVRLRNPQETELKISPEIIETEGVTLRISGVRMASGPYPSVSLKLEAENHTGQNLRFTFGNWIVNHSRSTGTSFSLHELAPGASDVSIKTIDRTSLLGIEEIRDLDFDLQISGTEEDGTEPDVHTVQLRIQDGDVSFLSAKAPEALAAPRTLDGITMRLCGLAEKQDGSITGMLYAQNDTEQEWNETGTILLNRVKMGGSVTVRLPAHTDGYFPFEAVNGDTLNSFSLRVADSRRLYHMGIPQALQQAGVDEISEAALYFGLSELQNEPGTPVTFSLSRPVPLRPAEPAAARKTLYESDQVSVLLESVFIADNGLALGLRMENRSGQRGADSPEAERDGTVSAKAGSINLEMRSPFVGETPFERFEPYDRITLPAGSRSVKCLVLRDDSLAGTEIGSLRFSFRIGNRDSTQAALRFPEGCAFGAEGGTLLSADQIEVVPAVPDTTPMVISEEVRLPADELTPLRIQAPLTDGEASRAVSVNAAICLLEPTEPLEPADSPAGGAANDAPPLYRHRNLVSGSLRRAESGAWFMDFSGTAVLISGEALASGETPLEEGSWRITPDSIYLYQSADAFPPDGENLFMSADVSADSAWTLSVRDGTPAVSDFELELFHWTDWDDERTNIHLSEVEAAAVDQRVYFGTDRTANWNTVDYSEASPLPLDEPLVFESVPLRDIPGVLGVYFVVRYEDHSREDILAAFPGGTILERTYMEKDLWE